MKQLLFLLLFPGLALAQYTGNGNQNIRLGEQTTADGLVFRGVANDTNVITPFSDTSAYIILDTVNSKFYHYNRTTTFWALAGGGGDIGGVTSFSAGTTGLTPSTATTGAVTLGGTLSVANGGTGSATQNFVDLTTNQTIDGLKTFSNIFTSTATVNAVFAATQAGTAARYLNIRNTSGGFLAGTEGSAGGFLITGLPPYYSVITGRSGLGISANDGTTNHMTILSGGDVGIGTTSPTEKLHVVGNARITGSVTATRFNANTTESGISSQYGSTNATNSYVSYIYNNSDIAYLGNGTSLFSGVNATDFGITTAISSNFIFGTNNLERMRIASGGEVTIANLAGSGSRAVNASATGVLSASSSILIKENVENINYGLSDVLKLKPVIFNYIDKDKWGEGKELGFIAEDVMDIIPESTGTMNNSDIYFDLQKLIPVLTKAIQEQNALIKALEQRILILENK